MLKINKIATITYATIKHLQGYKLLKNPKGTTPYEVNMIKYKRVSTPQCDEVYFYNRIKKSFDNIFPKSYNKYLISKHIFDIEKDVLSGKKNIVLYGGGVQGYFREREDVEEEVLNARKLLSLKKRLEQEDKFDIKESTKKYFAPKSNWDILEDFLTFGYARELRKSMYKNMPQSRGFFEILKDNLSQEKK